MKNKKGLQNCIAFIMLAKKRSMTLTRNSLSPRVGLALALACCCRPLSAGDITWIGVGADAKLGTSANWSAIPTDGDSLTFGAGFVSGTTLSNEFFTSVGGLAFSDTLPEDGLALQGNGFTLGAGGLVNSNTTAGSHVTIDNDIIVGANQVWSTVNDPDAVVILSGNLSGTGNVTARSNEGSVVVPTLRLAGDNADYTGNIMVEGADKHRRGIYLAKPSSMTGGNIDIRTCNDSYLWIQGGSGQVYTFGIGTGPGQVQFPTYSIGGLALAGGDTTWDPGNGGDYTWVDTAGNLVSFTRPDSECYWLNVGNASGRLVLSGFNKSLRGAYTPHVRLLSGLSDDGTARALTVAGNTFPALLLELSRPATVGNLGGSIVLSGGFLSVSDMNQIFDGNLSIGSSSYAGIFVFNGLGWSAFAADRFDGYGSGANQWQLSSNQNQPSGFAARGTDVIIPNDTSAGLSSSTFDRNIRLGCRERQVDGEFYANAVVAIARDTVLSAARTYNIEHSGPGVTGPDTGRPAMVFSGDLSGAGSLRVSGSGNSALDVVGELALGGANTWSGGVSVDIGGGYFNSGPGGMHVGTSFVRFDGNDALPTGNGGSPAFLGALQRYNTDFAFGFLFAGGETERLYELPSGCRFMIGGMGGAPDPGTLGATAGQSKLRNSTVLVHVGRNDSEIQMGLLVRENGVLTLGDAGVGSVRFVSSAGQDANSAASPTAVIDATVKPKRSLVKYGTGLLVLGNVVYTDVVETADKSANFEWRIGRAAGNQGSQSYDDGAVRSVYGGTTTNSIEPLPVRLVGGVWEIDASAQVAEVTLLRPLGQNAGQSTWSKDTWSSTDSSGGGGFAAYGQPVVVDLDVAGASALTWDSTGNFVQNGDPLILGSRSANRRLTLIDNIALNNANREIRVVDNPDSDDDRAAIGGVLSGTGSAALTKTGDGVLELLAGVAHTYVGTTTVESGTLLVNGALDAQTFAVTVDDGGVLSGTGTINRPVVVAPGGMIAAMDAASATGLQINGDLTVSGLVGLRMPVLAYGRYVVATVSGTLDVSEASLEPFPKGFEGEMVVEGDTLVLKVGSDALETAIIIR